MPDAIVSGAAGQVLQQGGLLGALLLLSIMGNLGQYLLSLKAAKAARDALAVVQEARVIEVRDTAKMLADGSANNITLANTNIARTNALEKVVTGFELLTSELKGGRERWGDRVDHIDKALEEIAGRLEDLQRNRAGGRP